MKNLNIKVWMLGALLLPAGLLISCAQNNSGSSNRCDTGRTNNTCTSANAQNTGISMVGVFTGTDPSAFQFYTEGLVAPTIDVMALGAVNDGTSPADNTGIVFGGTVSGNSAVKFSTAPAGTQVQSSSKVLVSVYDSLVGQIGATGQPIGPVNIPLANATGTFGGGQANITFSDNYGSITFNGTYTTTTFTGTVTYTDTNIVQTAADPQPPMTNSGTPFNFTIPTCSFFVCN